MKKGEIPGLLLHLGWGSEFLGTAGIMLGVTVDSFQTFEIGLGLALFGGLWLLTLSKINTRQ